MSTVKIVPSVCRLVLQCLPLGAHCILPDDDTVYQVMSGKRREGGVLLLALISAEGIWYDSDTVPTPRTVTGSTLVRPALLVIDGFSNPQWYH